MAETDGGSPISLDSSVADLFAEAVASVERHGKKSAGEDTGSPPDLGAEGEADAVIDFEMSDLDDLSGEAPLDAGSSVDRELESERRAAELEEELAFVRKDLEEAQSRLRRREQDIAAMLKRFEEAQKRYRAKVHEAEVSTQRANELKEQLDHRGIELKRLVDRLKLVSEQTDAVRRRAQREQQELTKYGNEKPFRALLSVIDNFERALLHAAASPEALQEGVEMILTQLISTLSKFGVNKVEAKAGDRFDPSLHEAMVRVPTHEHPPGSVFEVLQQGYIYHDRLLRATLVSVAQPDPSMPASDAPEAAQAAADVAPEAVVSSRELVDSDTPIDPSDPEAAPVAADGPVIEASSALESADEGADKPT